MDIHTLRSALHHQPFGHTIDYYPSVPSTMPLARALAEDAPAPAQISGAVVVADEQTAGRGRLERRWETPPGRALLVSVVVAGAHLPERPAQLPMIAGLAVLDAVCSIATPDRCPGDAGSHAPASYAARLSGVEHASFHLKWPNDLIALLPEGPMKLSGMLAESSLDSQGIRYAVLGIGINVNQRADELPTPRSGGLRPASLHTLFGHDFAREELLIALCHSLAGLLAGPHRPSAAEIHARWQAALINVGRAVVVHDRDEKKWAGQVVGTDIDGALLVEDESGRRVPVEAGDVSLETLDFQPHSGDVAR